MLKNEIDGFTDAMDRSAKAVENINLNIVHSAEKMHGMSEDNASVGQQIQETYEMVKSNSELSRKLKAIVEKYVL
ncbi:MAG: hypothetical protein ACI4SD_04515 [Suilimivivens sp.]